MAKRGVSGANGPGRLARAALNRRPVSWPEALAIGAVAAALALAARAALHTQWPGVVPFSTLFPAILLASLLAGARAGVVSLLLGGVASWYFFFAPFGSFELRSAADVVSLVLFAIAALMIIALAAGFRSAARGQAAALERQKLLVDELNHRVKNTLAVVQGLAVQTFKGDGATPEARRSFEQRLAALSAAQNVLTREHWESAALEHLVREAVGPYGGGERFGWSGPEIRLPPTMATSIALALHELATNAAKYGALTAPEGRVRIDWRVSPSETGDRLHLTWTESGGPPVEPPTRRGFGSRLIERGLSAQLKGAVRLDFPPSGVVCTLDAPLPTAPA